MLNFIKRYKITIIVVILILVGIGAYFGIKYYRENVGDYTPNGALQNYDIKNYNSNQYVVINKDNIDVYRAYYKEFMNLMANNPTQAYNKLTEETRNTLFSNDYNSFLKRQETLNKNTLLTSDITNYKVDKNRISVIDKYGEKYTFIESGVWNYTVEMYK